MVARPPSAAAALAQSLRPPIGRGRPALGRLLRQTRQNHRPPHSIVPQVLDAARTGHTPAARQHGSDSNPGYRVAHTHARPLRSHWATEGMVELATEIARHIQPRYAHLPRDDHGPAAADNQAGVQINQRRANPAGNHTRRSDVIRSSTREGLVAMEAEHLYAPAPTDAEPPANAHLQQSGARPDDLSSLALAEPDRSKPDLSKRVTPGQANESWTAAADRAAAAVDTPPATTATAAGRMPWVAAQAASPLAIADSPDQAGDENRPLQRFPHHNQAHLRRPVDTTTDLSHRHSNAPPRSALARIQNPRPAENFLPWNRTFVPRAATTVVLVVPTAMAVPRHPAARHLAE